MSIADNIKQLRKRNHLTQKQLAEKSGLAVITIQQYEAGKFNPKPDAVMKLCVGLKCKITDIIDDETQKYYRMFDNINSKPAAFDNAIQKFQKDEELSYEEEDAIIEYVESEQFKQEKEDIKRMAQKAYNHISYKHSHSYASSAEELDRLQDAKQIELEKQRAKPSKLYETAEAGPPKPFTGPLQGREFPKQKQGPKFDYLDETYFNFIRFKMARREPLTEEEELYRMFHLSTIFRIDIFAIYYFLLNKEGKSKADEIIDRAIEQIALLTKIPEYQKKPPEPPAE